MSDDIKPKVEPEDDEYAGLLAVPWRVQFNFTGAFAKDKDDIEVTQMMDAVIADAEARGLFAEFQFAAPMDPGDVIAESQLEEALTGRAVRRG